MSLKDTWEETLYWNLAVKGPLWTFKLHGLLTNFNLFHCNGNTSKMTICLITSSITVQHSIKLPADLINFKKYLQLSFWLVVIKSLWKVKEKPFIFFYLQYILTEAIISIVWGVLFCSNRKLFVSWCSGQTSVVVLWHYDMVVLNWCHRPISQT